MPARKPKLGIGQDTFQLGRTNRIDFSGIRIGGSGKSVTVGLGATLHTWRIIRQHPHTATGVRVDAEPTPTRAGRPRDTEDDLIVTITVDDHSGDPPVETEVTYDDILYEGRRRKSKAAKKKVAKKKK